MEGAGRPRPGSERRLVFVRRAQIDFVSSQDDYYLNLIDWSSNNVLAVGLGSCVYTWSAHTSEVKKLCDLADQQTPDSVTSIAWVQRVSCAF